MGIIETGRLLHGAECTGGREMQDWGWLLPWAIAGP